MKILVTGGAGFIGSAFIRHSIYHTQDQIVNLDKLTYAGNLEALHEVANDPRYAFELADICDMQAVQRILKEHHPDCVVHFAAESHVDRSIHGAAAFIQTNIVGTYTLLEAVRDYYQQLPSEKKKNFRFLHISTDEVYGDVAGTLDLSSETSAYAPSSPYSASKASSDHLVCAWHRTYGLPIIITHCANNYGPYQYPEKLIPVMILNALSGEPLPIYGNGQQIRDWLYVEDHVQALYLVLQQGRIGESYNISAHCEKTILEIVQVLCAILEELAPNKPQGIKRYQDLIVHTADRPGHDVRYALDATKIRQELYWQPQADFMASMRSTVQWYLTHLDWCAKVRS